MSVNNEVLDDVLKGLGHLYNTLADEVFPKEKVNKAKIRGYLSCAMYDVAMNGSDVSSDSVELKDMFNTVSEFKDIEMDVRNHRNDEKHEEFADAAIEKAQQCVDKTVKLFQLNPIKL